MIVYRAGLGRNLTANEFDGNFHDVDDRVTVLEDAPLPEFEFSEENGQLFVNIDSETQGPFTLPVAKFNVRADNGGEWSPLTVYTANDAFTMNGVLYVVLLAHTSAASFDAGANDGDGHDFYQAVLTFPGGALPVGGDDGQILKKFSDDDFDASWSDFAIEDLSDVDFATDLSAGDVLTYSGGAWSNEPPAAADFADLTGTATPEQVRLATVTDLGTTSGTVSLDPSLGDVFKITPNGAVTLNAASAPAGARITLIVTTSGTSSYNITPSTNFISTGVLATGTVSAKTFTISFIGDGANLIETSRTAAM